MLLSTLCAATPVCKWSVCVRFVYPNTLQSCLHSNQAKGAADLSHIYRRTYLESVTNEGFMLVIIPG